MSRYDTGAAVLPDRTRRKADAPRPNDPIQDSEGANSGRRDLVVVNPKQMPPKETQHRGKPSRYADTLFLAHMFASKFNAPQQREKRRADPADANASYRKSGKRPAKTGRVLSKKV
jgi:hypothetical protein